VGDYIIYSKHESFFNVFLWMLFAEILHFEIAFLRPI